MADPAILGECRLGYFRLGVKGPVYLDDIIKQLENQPVSSSGSTGATETILVWDEGNWDECYWA